MDIVQELSETTEALKYYQGKIEEVREELKDAYRSLALIADWLSTSLKTASTSGVIIGLVEDALSEATDRVKIT